MTPKPLLDQVEDLLTLERGWDSYDGLPPFETNVHKAASAVVQVAPLFDTKPDDWSLIPVSDGSVQAEISQNGWDVEIFIRNVEEVKNNGGDTSNEDR